MATYYISPTGSDGAAGGSSTPWKTFSFAIGNLVAGDTLILKNGTYDGSNSGYPNISSKNGTSGSLITIRAENERQAFINGTGAQNAFTMSSCSYWNIEGLRIKSADFNGSSNGDVMLLSNSGNVNVRRLLLSHNNRYKNSHLIQANTVSNCLFEEIEMYYFHRHGLSMSVSSNNNIIRRCYVNSRFYADIAGGYVSSGASRGDEGIAIYPGSSNIIENCISENNDSGYTINAAGLSQNNKILGCISLNDIIGIRLQARGTSLSTMPQDTTITNVVVINPASVGMYIRGSKNTRVDNVTIMGAGPNGGLVADLASPETGDGAPTTFSDNALVSLVTGTRFNFISQSSFLINYPNSHGSGAAFNPVASHASITNERTIDPQLGGAKIWIPSTSPMKGTGKNGADVGANIIYRYSSGVLTGTLLWGPSFPHGAIIAGVNDVAGNSAFDIHTRLGVMPTGAPPISDTTPPTVSITSPSNSSTVSGTITITATASDNVGVANVQFYLDGVPLGSPQV